MASEGISSPSEARVIIDNEFLDNAANDGVVIDIENLTPIGAFLHVSATKKLPKSGRNGAFDPRFISFNYASDGQGGLDTSATLATVDIQEKNEPYFHPFRGEVGVVHGLRVRKIRVGANTLARGIQVHQ